MAVLIQDEKCLVLKNRHFFWSNEKCSRLISGTSTAICSWWSLIQGNHKLKVPKHGKEKHHQMDLCCWICNWQFLFYHGNKKIVALKVHANATRSVAYLKTCIEENYCQCIVVVLSLFLISRTRTILEKQLLFGWSSSSIKKSASCILLGSESNLRTSHHFCQRGDLKKRSCLTVPQGGR